MLALKVTSAKNFMNQLLAASLFDPFLMIEGSLLTGITYNFDGHLNLDFYPAEERTAEYHPYEYQEWSEARGIIFNLVKGSNTPLHMKFMLQLKPDKALTMLKKEAPETDFSQLRALLLTIKYEAGSVVITTGSSYYTFIMDKTADIIWDKAAKQYLSAKGIDFEEM